MTAVGSRVISAAAASGAIGPEAQASAAAASPRRTGTAVISRRPTSLAVRIDEAGDDPGEHLAQLPLVDADQHRILERVLRQGAQFREILVQHLDLFDAGNRLAFRRAPDREFFPIAIGHDFAPHASPQRYLGAAGAGATGSGAACGGASEPGGEVPPSAVGFDPGVENI